MKITIIGVGRLKEKYWTMAVDEYLKRLSSYAKVEIVELQDEKTPDRASEKEELQIKEKEGTRILAKIPKDARVIALAIQGKSLSSEELADWISNLGLHGSSSLCFLIGGSLGLSDEVLRRADDLLSFSRMTFPHQMMRVILLEQIYRSCRIISHEPYHK